MKKFELTAESINVGVKKLFRIKALINFGNVVAGEIGGFVEKEENLSHERNAWVYGNAKVCGDAKVYGNAKVCGDALVYGNAEVCGDAKVYGNAKVCGDAKVYGDAEVHGDAWVCGDAKVCGDAWVCGNADYTTIKGFGTLARNTTFFKCKDGKVRVSCGCFYGTIYEFREQVKKTREGKIVTEYLMIADLMAYHFSEEKQGGTNQ